jgi:hypothetical protein
MLLLAAVVMGGSTAARAANDPPAHEDVPIFRGRVVTQSPGVYALAACTNGEWPSCEAVTASELGVSELQMVVWATRGSTIQVFGKWSDEPDETGCFSEVEAAKSTPAFCAGLPVERVAWGSLKSSYR